MEDDFSLQHANIAIIGLGLMGGSLALALRKYCSAIFGCDLDLAILEAARERQIVDLADVDPAKILPGADAVILAAPVMGILRLLEALPCVMPDPCIVMDIGSTKEAIVAAMAQLPQRFDPIGGHPLCGKEKLSLDNAEEDLYQGAPFVLAPIERTTSRALSAAQQIAEAVGAKPMLLNAAEHDRILSATSHLPFLLASALALSVPSEYAGLAGPGFRSTSRLAGTPSSMMLGVLQTNRQNILHALHGLQNELGGIETALASEDLSQLEAILDNARRQHEGLVQ